MKKILLYIGIAIAAISCTKDVDVDQSVGNALTITSNITTRVANGQWQKNDAIGVYMTSPTFGNLGENVKYITTEGNGIFSSTPPLYYPPSGEVEIFAYYPHVDNDELNLEAYPINSKDQVDLLSVTRSNLTTSPSAVELTFNHLLSMVSITIKAGGDLTDADLEGLSVTLSGISTEVDFNIVNPDASSLTNSGAELTLTTTTVDDVITSSAIVIPQTLNGATLCFTTKNYGTFSTTLSTSAFSVGNKYSYTATVDFTGVELAATNIHNWEGEDSAEQDSADLLDIELRDGTYYINTAVGLKAFADLVNGEVNDTATSNDIAFSDDTHTSINGVLTGDIDLSSICGKDITVDGVSWTPIGYNYNAGYMGTFDGGGYEVSELYINDPNSDYQGLFGYIRTNAEINNLGVSGSVSAGSYVGGIVGYSSGGGDITSCYNTATVSGTDKVGGIAGQNYGRSNITKCYNSGDVSGTSEIGGVTGSNYTYSGAGGTPIVSSCFNTGNVSGGEKVGGVIGNLSGSQVGFSYYNSRATGCYNTGNVKGSNYVGGVVGYCYTAATSLTSSYSVGSVSCSATENYSIGGVVGGYEHDGYVNINYCYYNYDTVANEKDGTYVTTPSGAVNDTDSETTYCGLSTSDMQGDVLLDYLNTGSADSYKSDTGINGGYPILTWQGVTE